LSSNLTPRRISSAEARNSTHSFARQQVPGVQGARRPLPRGTGAFAESGDIHRHWSYLDLSIQTRQHPPKVVSQKLRGGGDSSRFPEHRECHPAEESAALEEADVRAVTGDEKRHLRPADEPPGRQPPVGMNHVGRKAADGGSHGVSKGEQKAGKRKRGEGRAEGLRVQAAGVGHPLECLGSIPETAHSGAG